MTLILSAAAPYAGRIAPELHMDAMVAKTGTTKGTKSGFGEEDHEEQVILDC